MFPLDIRIGPLLFEYEIASHKLRVSCGEDHWATLEGVSEDDWTAFFNLAATPQAQGAPLR